MERRIIIGWTFLLTYGEDLDLYARGRQRKVIDRRTGRQVCKYTV